MKIKTQEIPHTLLELIAQPNQCITEEYESTQNLSVSTYIKCKNLHVKCK